MRKFWLILVLLSTLVLAACGQAAATNTPAANDPAAPTKAAIPDGPPMECSVFSILPEPKDPATVNVPAVSADDWVRGAKNPRILLVEYSDFQCPYCSLAASFLKEFETQHPDEVQVVFRHFPLTSIHDKAMLGAQAAEAAGLQGKFWEMHDAIFNQESWQVWTQNPAADFETFLAEQAKAIGLDEKRFEKDLKSDAVVSKVEKALKAATDLGLQGTPALFIYVDGQLIFTPEDQVPYDIDTLNAILSLAKLKDKQYTQCPPMIIDPAKQYTATITTSKGDIKVKLYADRTPLAVNNFVFLAKMGYFDGVSFHRVIKDFVAQTGDPSGTGFGGPGYQFKNEVFDDLKFDRAGLLGMANSGADTNGSQFFITYKELPDLDGGYTIFGEVLEGLDIAQQLTLRDPAQAQPGTELPAGDTIVKITIEEK